MKLIHSPENNVHFVQFICSVHLNAWRISEQSSIWKIILWILRSFHWQLDEWMARFRMKSILRSHNRFGAPFHNKGFSFYFGIFMSFNLSFRSHIFNWSDWENVLHFGHAIVWEKNISIDCERKFNNYSVVREWRTESDQKFNQISQSSVCVLFVLYR